MRIIPAIDLIDGQCVRLEKGDYSRKKNYHSDPLEVAKSFEDAGLKYLHLVDLDGAKAGQVVNWEVLDRIVSQTSLVVDFGGGIKSTEDLKIILESGASQVNVGSLAVKNRTLFLNWLETYGGDRLILSADVRNRLIAISGWQEQTELSVDAFIGDYMAHGIQRAVVTDIARDGMLQGPSFGLYRELLTELPSLQLVASGGITTLHDLDQLHGLGLDGAIIGKAIYEGRLSLAELQAWSEGKS